MPRKSKVERPTIGKRKKKWLIEIWLETDNEPHPVSWDWEGLIGNEPNLIVMEKLTEDKWSYIINDKA